MRFNTAAFKLQTLAEMQGKVEKKDGMHRDCRVRVKCEPRKKVVK